MAGVVHVPIYATGFRGDAMEASLAELAPLAMRYGATGYRVYRYREDRYKFLLEVAFEDKVDWERFWHGDDFVDWRVRHSSWYQVPLLYGWVDLVTNGEMGPQPVTAGRGSGEPQGDTV